MDHRTRHEALSAVGHCAHAALFGDFHLNTAEGTEIPISNRRAKALLAVLCLIGDEAIDRDAVCRVHGGDEPGLGLRSGTAEADLLVIDADGAVSPIRGAMMAMGGVMMRPVRMRTQLLGG